MIMLCFPVVLIPFTFFADEKHNVIIKTTRNVTAVPQQRAWYKPSQQVEIECIAALPIESSRNTMNPHSGEGQSFRPF